MDMKKSYVRNAAMLFAACLVSQTLTPCAFAAGEVNFAPDPAEFVPAVESRSYEGTATASAICEQTGTFVPDLEESSAEEAEQQARSDSPARVLVVSQDKLGSVFTIFAQNVPDSFVNLSAEVYRRQNEKETKSYPMTFDGMWSAQASVADFHFGYGWYGIRVRAVSADGTEYILGEASHYTSVAGKPVVEAAPADEEQTSYRLTLSGVTLPGNPVVWFEVRSEKNSEDRMAVCRAYPKNGTYNAFVRIADHAQSGTYEYSAFCGEYPEHKNLVSSGTFEVDGVSSASASFENINRSNGTFRIRARAQAPAGIRFMLASVWSRGDKSDQRMALMKRDGGSWYADFGILEDFGGNFGAYRVQVHAVLANGIKEDAGAANQRIDPENYVWCEKAENGRCFVHIVNPNPADSVAAAVWSDEGGQDDIVWYPASADGNGTYTAEVKTRRHRSDGVFHAHVYSGLKFLGASDFEVPEGEVREFPEIPDPPTKRESWYFMRNKSKTPPKGAWSSENLLPYDAYYLGDTSRKVIYLAFDTGYDNGNTERILDTLRDNDVRAAFFVTKGFLRSCPDLAVRMAEEGHVVGNHTMSHPDMTKLTAAEHAAELEGCANLYEEITGKEMDPFVRPPEGVFSGKSLLRNRDLGYTTIFWSLAYMDYDVSNQPSVSSAYSKIVDYVHPGCITLLHTVSSANAGALDRALRTLKSEGYVFESLYDLP